MTLQVGSNSIGEIYFGNQAISEVYKGSDLIWSSAADIPEYIFRNLDSNGKLTTPTGSLKDASSIKKIKDYSLSYAFSYCENITGAASFPELTTVNSHGLEYAFSNCTSLTSASFPKLTTMGVSGLSYGFYTCSGLTSASFPELVTIDSNGLTNAFRGSGLTSISFPKLTTISSSQPLASAFYNCTALTDIYFNSLTTSSFGSRTNQFQDMLKNTGTSTTHTLHFPSNISSNISSLTGYPTFGGTSGYVVLAFDLPATS